MNTAPLPAPHDWDLEVAAFRAANTDLEPAEYQTLIKRLWGSYCAIERRLADLEGGKDVGEAGPMRLRMTPDVSEAAVKAYDAYLREVDTNSPLGAVACAAEAALRASARIALPVHDDIEAYPLDAFLWKRPSTDEWVLDLSGTINDTHFSVRHTQPGVLAPEDAVGLPHHYDLIDAAENVVRVADHGGDLFSAIRVMGVEVGLNQPAPVKMGDET